MIRFNNLLDDSEVSSAHVSEVTLFEVMKEAKLYVKKLLTFDF